MVARPLDCPKCRAPLPAEVLIGGTRFDPCPTCSTGVRVLLFPALFRPIETARSAETVTALGESSCFFHPEKRAELPCDGCGRFLCALCDLEFHGKHLCPACLELARKKGRIVNLQNTRTMHDGVALALAILPMLIFYFTLITAPLALFWAIRFWNAPSSLLPRRRRLRLVIAIVLASCQIIGWIALFIALATGVFQ